MTKGRPGAPDYGYQHARQRRAWQPIVAAGKAICARCGRRILPSQQWDLGHDDANPGKYSGPEHAYCNRAAGARKGNARRTYAPRTPPHTPQSRQWW